MKGIEKKYQLGKKAKKYGPMAATAGVAAAAIGATAMGAGPGPLMAAGLAIPQIQGIGSAINEPESRPRNANSIMVSAHPTGSSTKPRHQSHNSHGGYDKMYRGRGKHPPTREQRKIIAEASGTYLNKRGKAVDATKGAWKTGGRNTKAGMVSAHPTGAATTGHKNGGGY